MPKESQEDRLGKLLVVMERYFEELNEGDRPSRRPPPDSRSVPKQVKTLIASYKIRKTLLSGPDLKNVATTLIKSAQKAHALMDKITEWAELRAEPSDPKSSY